MTSASWSGVRFRRYMASGFTAFSVSTAAANLPFS